VLRNYGGSTKRRQGRSVRLEEIPFDGAVSRRDMALSTTLSSF
jgi:hypothetical protein